MAYQEYSGSKEKRVNLLTKEFLNEQIKIFKEKTEDSIRKAQEFASTQDLKFILNSRAPEYSSFSAIQSSYKGLNSSLSPSLVPSNVGIENIRINNANKIRKIDLKIKKIKEIGEDSEQLKFISSTIPGLIAEKASIENLNNIESRLFIARSKYTDIDRTVINLLEKRNIVLEQLKERAIGYLNAEKLEAEAEMESASRPKGVLLKYKNLVRNAERDESTLISLEEQLRFLELEESKKSDPWKLITNPTLLTDPIAPIKRNIAFLGFLSGFSLGILISKIKERRLNKIFNAEILERIFSAPIIQKVNIVNIDKNDFEFIFLREFLRNNYDKKICLYAISEGDKKYLTKIKNCIINSKDLEKMDNLKLILNKNKFEDFIHSHERFLVVSLDNTNKDDLEHFNRKLKIFNINLSGLILLENC